MRRVVGRPATKSDAVNPLGLSVAIKRCNQGILHGGGARNEFLAPRYDDHSPQVRNLMIVGIKSGWTLDRRGLRPSAQRGTYNLPYGDSERLPRHADAAQRPYDCRRRPDRRVHRAGGAPRRWRGASSASAGSRPAWTGRCQSARSTKRFSIWPKLRPRADLIVFCTPVDRIAAQVLALAPLARRRRC